MLNVWKLLAVKKKKKDTYLLDTTVTTNGYRYINEELTIKKHKINNKENSRAIKSYLG